MCGQNYINLIFEYSNNPEEPDNFSSGDIAYLI